MRRQFSLVLALLWCLPAAAHASGKQAAGLPASAKQTTAPITANAAPESGSEQGQTPEALQRVLHSMDENAAKFRSAQADFVWTNHNSVVDEDESSKGKIYFRRSGNQIEMSAMVFPPDQKQVVFAHGRVEVYQPKMGIVDVYDTSAHREEIETFLVLGFGSSGQDLRKNFKVKYAGQENVGGVETAKLQLTPVAENVRVRFPQIDLWMDPSRGLSLRQKLYQTGGDYRIADYSHIQVDQKVSESVFKLKTSGKTRTITH